MKAKVDDLGRIVIPKQYSDFYHLNNKDVICVTATKEGVLISNPQYKVVKMNQELNTDKL